MSKYKSREEWFNIHQKAVNSPMGLQAYLESQGINIASYYNARQRFKFSTKTALNSKKPGLKGKQTKGDFIKFVPESDTGITVSLPTGAKITVAKGDKESLRTVLSVINEGN